MGVPREVWRFENHGVAAEPERGRGMGCAVGLGFDAAPFTRGARRVVVREAL